MYVVKEVTHACTEVKKSRFISYLMPIEVFDATLIRIKKEHSKASHFVNACRFTDEFGRITGRQSDDGEPGGSSGKPTLSILAGNDLIETAVVTVRYFGGVKLGVGGLVRAYSEAARSVILASDLQPFIRYQKVSFQVTYPILRKFEHMVHSFNVQSVQKEFYADFVLVTFGIEEASLASLLQPLKEVNGVQQKV